MLPEVLAVDDNNRGERGVELIQEAGVDANSTRRAVSFSVSFNRQAVAECGATTMDAEVMRHLPCVPSVDRVVVWLHGRVELAS